MPRAHLSGRRTLGEHRRRVSEQPAENRRQHARRKAQLAHRQHRQPVLGHRLGRRQHPQIVGRFARRRHHLIRVRRYLHHAVNHRVHRRRGFVIVIRNNHLHAPAERAQPLLRHLRRLNLDIDGARPGFDRQFQNGKLFFDAAVVTPVILVPPAGGQNDALGELLQESPYRLGALRRPVQEVQPEFQENFARLSFVPGVAQQCWNIWQAQRDAYAREQPRLRHVR